MHISVIVLALCFSLSSTNCLAQQTVKKSLYYQDTSLFLACGGSAFRYVLFFSSKPKANLNKPSESYYIIVACPDIYGSDFWVKRVRYDLELDKEFKTPEMYSDYFDIEKLKKLSNAFRLVSIRKRKQVVTSSSRLLGRH